MSSRVCRARSFRKLIGQHDVVELPDPHLNALSNNAIAINKIATIPITITISNTDADRTIDGCLSLFGDSGVFFLSTTSSCGLGGSNGNNMKIPAPNNAKKLILLNQDTGAGGGGGGTCGDGGDGDAGVSDFSSP